VVPGTWLAQTIPSHLRTMLVPTFPWSLQTHSRQATETHEPASWNATTNKIPHILHHIFLSGYDSFIRETEKPNAKMLKWHYDSCLHIHQHWEVKFWTQSMAYDLLSMHYSWFLPIWDDYILEVSLQQYLRHIFRNEDRPSHACRLPNFVFLGCTSNTGGSL